MGKLILHNAAVIVFLGVHLALFSQIDNNAALYQKVLKQDFLDRGNQVNRFQGTVYEDLIPAFERDSLAGNIIIGAPNIQYIKLGKGRFIRNFRMSITRQNSNIAVEQYHIKDTLNYQQLRKVLSKSPKALKGDNPTIWGRIGKPVSIIAGSTSAIILLFFIRSP